MVTRPGRAGAALGLAFGLAAYPVWAEGPWDRMFAGAADCYARSYSSAHLADHPAQRVTDIALTPDRGPAQGELRLILELRLRGMAETLLATAYCDPATARALNCKLEGDAGGFTVTPAKDDALTLTVGP